MEGRTTTFIIPAENKREVTEFLEFLGELTAEEKKEFRMFMQGVKFVKTLEKTAQRNRQKGE